MADSPISDQRIAVLGVSDARAPWGLMRSHLAHWISFGFGSGLSPVAPGTVATLWAWLSFLVIDAYVSDIGWMVLLVTGFILGVWACTFSGRALGETDNSSIVWDEIIAFWLVLWVLPKASDPAGLAVLGRVPEWAIQSVGFALFRFFDIAKPAPIGWVDAVTRDGFGVMADDLIAAGYTLLVAAVLFTLVQWMGR